jgi:hypothetical protein
MRETYTLRWEGWNRAHAGVWARRIAVEFELVSTAVRSVY